MNYSFYDMWNYYQTIEDDFMRTQRYVEHCANNVNTFSNEFAKIILLACSELDDVFKTTCRVMGKPQRSFIRAYAKVILPTYPWIKNEELYIGHRLTVGVKLTCIPFTGWTIETPPDWWEDYQGLKHNRNENSQKATLNNAFNSVAALRLMLDIYLHLKEHKHEDKIIMIPQSNYISIHSPNSSNNYE